MRAEPQPWQRQRGESHQAFEAFTTYLEMGSGRSLTLVAEKSHKHRELMGRWSRRWNWVERVSAWDSEQARAQRQAELDVLRERADRHARETAEYEDTAFEVGKLLIERAKLMLQHPLVERIVTDSDGRQITIKPVQWRATDAARYVEAADKLIRLSRGMETERVALVDLEAEKARLREEALREGLDADAAVAEFERILSGE